MACNCCDSCTGTGTVSVAKGETKTLTFTARDQDCNPIDLTGAKVVFSVKRVGCKPPLFIKKNGAAGGSDSAVLVVLPQTGTTIGEVQVFLVPSDTQSLSYECSYEYDVLATKVDGSHLVVQATSDFCVMPTVGSFPS